LIFFHKILPEPPLQFTSLTRRRLKQSLDFLNKRTAPRRLKTTAPATDVNLAGLKWGENFIEKIQNKQNGKTKVVVWDTKIVAMKPEKKI
tara:strand:- start:210 stop:479 length:270 start_codon:yes stop_codon:yes gene_type:complete